MSRSNSLRADPTRTATIRRLFLASLRKRFKRLAALIVDKVVDQDAFGRAPRYKMLPEMNQLTINLEWAALSSQDQATAFREWLATQVSVEILTAVNTSESVWWKAYIDQAFAKGMGRSFDDLKKAGAFEGNLPGRPFYSGNKEEFLRSAFGQPVTVEKINLLAARVLSELEGMTDAMAQKLTRALIDGLVAGNGPREIASDIVKQLDISYPRAETIARTEIIRAHAEGQLDLMERMGAKRLKVMVEWSTAGDDRVCPQCADKEGLTIKIEDAHGMIPIHPNCRCTWIPANLLEMFE